MRMMEARDRRVVKCTHNDDQSLLEFDLSLSSVRTYNHIISKLRLVKIFQSLKKKKKKTLFAYLHVNLS